MLVVQVEDMAGGSSRSGSGGGGVSPIDSGWADVGFRGALTGATPWPRRAVSDGAWPPPIYGASAGATDPTQ
jgi:hypothetical protein